MTYEEFVALSEGDKVIFLNITDDDAYGDDLPPIGTVMTRKKDWCDDNKCNCFEYEVDGVKDYHYFYPEEIEKVE